MINQYVFYSMVVYSLGISRLCIEALEFLIQFVVQIAEAAFDQTVGDPDLLLASAKGSNFRRLICKNTWLNHV